MTRASPDYDSLVEPVLATGSRVAKGKQLAAQGAAMRAALVASRVLGSPDDDIPAPVMTAACVLFPAAQAVIAQYVAVHTAETARPPSVVQDAALVRLFGWMFENDPADGDSQGGLRRSGAASLLSQWRVVGAS